MAGADAARLVRQRRRGVMKEGSRGSGLSVAVRYVCARRQDRGECQDKRGKEIRGRKDTGKSRGHWQRFACLLSTCPRFSFFNATPLSSLRRVPVIFCRRSCCVQHNTPSYVEKLPADTLMLMLMQTPVPIHPTHRQRTNSSKPPSCRRLSRIYLCQAKGLLVLPLRLRPRFPSTTRRPSRACGRCKGP